MPKTLLEGELFFLSVSVDLISVAVYSKQRLTDLSMVISTDNSSQISANMNTDNKHYFPTI